MVDATTLGAALRPPVRATSWFSMSPQIAVPATHAGQMPAPDSGDITKGEAGRRCRGSPGWQARDLDHCRSNPPDDLSHQQLGEASTPGDAYVRARSAPAGGPGFLAPPRRGPFVPCHRVAPRALWPDAARAGRDAGRRSGG